MRAKVLGPLTVLIAIYLGQQVAAQTITGTIDYEDIFIDVFQPNTGSGISISANNSVFIGGADTGNDSTSLADSGFREVDLDGDLINDVRVNVSYSLQKSGDSRIGFRQNAGGDALTFFSDSNTGTDFDYGILEVSWQLQSLQEGFSVSQIQDVTTSSLNGETELYEFGIIDAGSPDLTLGEIAAYDAQDYDGGDDFFSGVTNSLGDADEILLPEFLGPRPGVVYDAEATITGDLGVNPNTVGNASDSIGISGAGISEFTLFYGGFDVGTDTNVGNPSANINSAGTTILTVTVPEPSSLPALMVGMLCWFNCRRRKM